MQHKNFKMKIFIDLCWCVFFSNLFVIAYGSGVKETVPVLIWDGKKPPIQAPAVSAFPIPVSHLESKYLKDFDSRNIILFLLDTLSVEDLSSHECVFKHTSKLMENSHSLYLPAVETKHSLQHTLSSEGYNVITLQPGSPISELKLKKDAKNLVLVKLPSTTTNPSRQKALQKADEVVGNVISKVGKVVDFTVIFTGEKPSVALENEIDHRRVARAAIENPKTDPKFHYTPCVILYLRNDIMLYYNNNTYALKNEDVLIDLFDCRGDSANIMIKYKNVNDFQKLRVSFNFVRHTSRWTMLNAGFNVMKDSETHSATLLPLWPMEDVPMNKSYACTRNMTFISNVTDDRKVPLYRLTVDGMQVQAFSNLQKSFSDGWDCVGFFTIPIWTGLIAGVILVFILLIGLFMLSEVKTMDRFDDPKGQHIAVTGSNE